MEPYERVKILRKDQKLTLEKFAERLGVRASAIARIEHGQNRLTDRMIIAICHEFGASELWMRTGEGDMYKLSETISLDEYARQYGASDLDMELVRAYFSIDKEVRQKFLDQMLSAVSAEHQKATASLHEELDREIALQKKAEDESTGSDSIAG